MLASIRKYMYKVCVCLVSAASFAIHHTQE